MGYSSWGWQGHCHCHKVARLGMLALLWMLSTCGTGKETETDPPRASDSWGSERAFAMLGPAGGTLRLTRGEAAGATLVIPPGALLNRIQITMRRTEAPNDLPRGVLPAGPFLDFDPDGLTFLKPVTVTLPASNRANSVYWHSHSVGWERVQDAYKSPAGAIVATLRHFSHGGPAEEHCGMAPGAPPSSSASEYADFAIDPVAPEDDEVDYKQDEQPSELDPFATDREEEDRSDAMIHPLQIPHEVFPDLGPRFRWPRSQIAQFSEGYASMELRHPNVGMVLAASWVRDDPKNTNAPKHPPLNGEWLFPLVPIAAAVLIPIPGRNSSWLALTEGHRVWAAIHAADALSADNSPPQAAGPRPLAVLFGGIPRSTHRRVFGLTALMVRPKHKTRLPYIDVPPYYTPLIANNPNFPHIPPSMRTQGPGGAHDLTAVPRRYKAYRVKNWDVLGGQNNFRWPRGGPNTQPTTPFHPPDPYNPIPYRNAPNYHTLMRNSLVYLVLDSWVRTLDSTADRPATSYHSADPAHNNQPWFEDRPASNGTNAMQPGLIPEDTADWDHVQDLVRPPITRMCTRTTGVGLKRRDPPTPLGLNRPLTPGPVMVPIDPPMEVPGETQMSSWATIYPQGVPPDYGYTVPLIADLWLGASPAYFLYGDEGSVLEGPFGRPPNHNRVMFIGLLVQGDNQSRPDPYPFLSGQTRNLVFARWLQLNPNRRLYTDFLQTARRQAMQYLTQYQLTAP